MDGLIHCFWYIFGVIWEDVAFTAGAVSVSDLDECI